MVEYFTAGDIKRFYNGISYKERVCTCNQKSDEDLGHVAFCYQPFALECEKYLGNILLRYLERADNDILIILLMDKSKWVILQMAKFVV